MSFEAILILPPLVALVLMARVVAESHLIRSDTASDARQSVVAMSETEACWPTRTDGGPRIDVRRRVRTFCWLDDAEEIAEEELRFDDAMRNAASAATFLLDDVGPEMRADTVFAQAFGRARFRAPDFLHNRRAAQTTQLRDWPTKDTWTEDDQPWRDGLDPTIWRQIQQIGDAEKLFPRVFPAAIN
ncbi:hypothetical protein ACMU_08890 [Actibacterium mucosum KCTC 23349]|uniref:Uncharacterized protein n=1 Tax=Actibacterium mucosum KCTC 23349 TaxID=1454373 RepID=A0A037ZJU3_9RHOB|nr:hypothetical protein ACMU_08890 [Actibacterium mucosum KCTC 23349]